mmetsp:Transcript_12523/g.18754  ORF Transcript_12523/g.18754 Transcript_12523/m.18754 type:complete len:634 (+) Transcript_12523:2-1903(+)
MRDENEEKREIDKEEKEEKEIEKKEEENLIRLPTHEHYIEMEDEEEEEEMKDDEEEMEEEGYLIDKIKDTYDIHSMINNGKFNEHQEKAIQAAMDKKDLLAVLPTGGGEISLCYQLPAVMQKGVTMVVSPLVSLIDNQVKKLRENYGIKAIALTNSMPRKTLSDIFERLRNGDPVCKLIYATPEKLFHAHSILDLLKDMDRHHILERFVIEEAHCISQWGTDFRYKYLDLNRLKVLFPKVPISAMTETATLDCRKDLIEKLRLENMVMVVSSFNRPNLRYEVRPKKGWRDTIIDIISCFNNPGIIYCLSRKECEKVAGYLNKNNISAGIYHSKHAKNELHYDQWLKEELKVIVATFAFAMYLDKPTVRFVIHFSLPKTIEDYYLAAGRAGRDGGKSLCVILYSLSDRSRLRTLKDSWSKKDQEGLKDMMNYCESVVDCRRSLQIEHFGESFDRANCHQMCDNCDQRHKVLSIDRTTLSKHYLQTILLIDKVAGATANHSLVSHVLLGSRVSRIKKFNLQSLNTFATGQGEKNYVLDKVFGWLLDQNFIVEKRVGGKFYFIKLLVSSKGKAYLKSTHTRCLLYVRHYRLPVASQQLRPFKSFPSSVMDVFYSNVVFPFYKALSLIYHSLFMDLN